MAIDQLIEDGDNYYYVDINGVMAANQWVAIDNEDAGQDDEPDHYWYYFQANGKALTQGDNDKVSLKTVNGKKYAFDDESPFSSMNKSPSVKTHAVHGCQKAKGGKDQRIQDNRGQKPPVHGQPGPRHDSQQYDEHSGIHAAEGSRNDMAHCQQMHPGG